MARVMNRIAVQHGSQAAPRVGWSAMRPHTMHGAASIAASTPSSASRARVSTAGDARRQHGQAACCQPMDPGLPRRRPFGSGAPR